MQGLMYGGGAPEPARAARFAAEVHDDGQETATISFKHNSMPVGADVHGATQSGRVEEHAVEMATLLGWIPQV